MLRELSNLVHMLNEEFESRFALVSSSYSSASFGDSVAVYSNKELNIRLSRDRGEFNCEFSYAGSGPNWISIYHLFPNLPRSQRPEDEMAAIQAVLAVMAERYSEILSCLKQSQ